MTDEYILKRNALAILMGDKVDLSPNFVSISTAIDPSSIAKFKDLNFTCDRHIDLIKAIPAEDVVPVVHGKWENQSPVFCWNKYGFYQTAFKCSVCSELTPIDYNICPWCGAKMDGE